MADMTDRVSLLKQTARDLVKTWSAAGSTRSTSEVAKFYSKDPDLVFFDLGPIHAGWDQYRTRMEDWFDTIDSLELSLANDLRAMVRGVSGITTATGHISYRNRDGTSFDSDIRFSGVWEIKDGDWHLIHEHWSRLRRPAV